MPTIIRDLPYFDQPTRVQLRGRSFSVKRDQIILWISISEKGLPQPDPRVPCFPAILDIGCNYNLLINERHLTAWAGIQPGYLRQLVRIRVAGEPVSHLAANAWLHPNVPGKRDDFASQPPFLLELLPGIGVYPGKEGQPLYPRLPLVGLRAFRQRPQPAPRRRKCCSTRTFAAGMIRWIGQTGRRLARCKRKPSIRTTNGWDLPCHSADTEPDFSRKCF